MTAAKNSTRPTDAPHCWTDPVQFPAKSFGVRHPDCDWCVDGAASCRAYGPDMKPPTEFPPCCAGCARKERDDGIRAGTITPHAHRTGPRPMRDGVKVAA